MANSKGKYGEAFVTINVGGAVEPEAPTQSATNLTFSNIRADDLTASWTRGNGERNLLTCTPCGITPALPQDGTDYGYSSNYSQAPVIGSSSTRVVFDGTGSSRLVEGLQEGACYQFRVYEYNGTGTETLYRTTNPAAGSVSTAGPYSVDFTWDPNPIIAGEPVYFQWSSSTGGISIENWTFQGGTPGTAYSEQGQSPNNIIFASPGNYMVRLDGYLASTEQWASRTKLVTVLDYSSFQPDLVFQNTTVDPASVLPGHDTELCYTIANQRQDKIFLSSADIYFSTDDQLDGNDHFYSQEFWLQDIAGGGSVSDCLTLEIPNSAPVGTRYLIIQMQTVISSNDTPESNTANNIIAIPIEVEQAMPDLTMQNISISGNTFNSGASFDIEVDFTNIGNGLVPGSPCIDFNIYLSSDNQLSPDDGDYFQGMSLDNGSWCVSANYVDQPGNTLTHQRTVTTKPWLASGNYWLIFTFDLDKNGTQEVTESNENNNVFAFPITIANPSQPSVPANDITVTNVTGSSATVSWSNGNGQGRVVLLSSGSATNRRYPFDGYTYSANNHWPDAGNWADPYENWTDLHTRIIYQGTGSQVNVTGLDPDKTWFVSVYEYNGSGAGVDYLQAQAEVVFFHTDSGSNGYLTRFVRPNANDLELEPIRVIFQPPNRLLAFGDNGKLLTSNDGGLTFRFSQLPSLIDFQDVDFADQQTGVGVGFQDRIMRTTDGGNTWQELDPDPNVELSRFYRVHFNDATTGFLLGRRAGDDAGIIYRTTDAGSSWDKVFISTSNRLHGISHYGNLLWVSGNNGSILFSSDNGSSWSYLPNNLPSSTVTNIQFLSETIGYVHADGKLRKTVDGGYTWMEVYSYLPTNYFSRHFFFSDSLRGQVITSTDNLLRTNDGGQNWESNSLSGWLTGLSTFGASTWIGGDRILEVNCQGSIYYRDADGDGYGDDNIMVESCSTPAGYAPNGGDCDDSNPNIHPGAPEICDGLDNNCNGLDDEPYLTYYQDADGDGFGDPAHPVQSCSIAQGIVDNALDCDDGDNNVYPGAPEICDGKDNNCNGMWDEPYVTYYQDADGDGFGDPNQPVLACGLVQGIVANAGDCDDTDDSVYPGAPEICDGKDNNCNGMGDEPFLVLFLDQDGDGYGNPAEPVAACEVGPGIVNNADDCDDSNSNVYPGAPELCDGLDNNCDGQIDEGLICLTCDTLAFWNLGTESGMDYSPTYKEAGVNASLISTSSMIIRYGLLGFGNPPASFAMIGADASTFNADDYTSFEVQSNVAPVLVEAFQVDVRKGGVQGYLGADHWVLKSSLDNFNATLAQGQITSVEQWETISVDLTGAQIQGSAIEFRLYAFGATHVSWGRLYLDNFLLCGKLADDCPEDPLELSGILTTGDYQSAASITASGLVESGNTVNLLAA